MRLISLGLTKFALFLYRIGVLTRLDYEWLSTIFNVEEKEAEMISKYVVVRTSEAGVHAGILDSVEGSTVVLKDSRRIWYWAGAATLSELAMQGTSKPFECKFPMAVEEIMLLGAIEVIPTTAEAELSIRNVPVWTAHD